MGSYNYLGYAENEGPRIETITNDIVKDGVGLSTAPNELGMCLMGVCVLFLTNIFLSPFRYLRQVL